MQLIQEGARLGCAHSKGILGGCFLFGEGVEREEAGGSALLKDSVAAGSCYGQCVRPHPLHPPPTAACDALLLQVRSSAVPRAADRSCGGVRGRVTGSRRRVRSVRHTRLPRCNFVTIACPYALCNTLGSYVKLLQLSAAQVHARAAPRPPPAARA